MIYGSNPPNRYDTCESYNDSSYRLANQSNKDIFHEDMDNSVSVNEQVDEQIDAQSK
jgi:hypothetical protein